MIILVSPQAHYPSHTWPNTVALMRALRQKGCNVRAVIFSTTTQPVPPDLQASVEPVFSRLPPRWRHVAAGKWQERRFGGLMNICETLACLFKALRQTRGHSEPVLHFIGGSYWIVVLATLWFKRVRFVYSLYDCMLSGPATGLKARLRPRLKTLLQRAAATGRIDFTCENELLHEDITALVGPHVHVIPYAIDDTEMLPSREEARQRLGLPLSEKIILFFGTHRREKDYHTALKGCLVLPQPPLALFVGKVISDNDPKRVVADCGYPNARIVDEFVPEEMTKYYFAAADAVALPYEANFARGSGVLIECCRHLRPLIASATPYFSAFLTRYPCGVSYVPSDSASFALATRSLLADSKNYLAGLEQARRDHSWNAAANQYIELYESLRAGGKASATS
jgi:glycosyltransferase involved in cell wall biosynthesis